MAVEVSKQRFYELVGPRDVVTECAGRYPYTTIFWTRYGEVEVGRIVPTGEPGEPGEPPPVRYLITEQET